MKDIRLFWIFLEFLELGFDLCERVVEEYLSMEVVRELLINRFGIERNLFKILLSFGVVIGLWSVILECGNYFLFDIWGGEGIDVIKVFVEFFLENLEICVLGCDWVVCLFLVKDIFDVLLFFMFW